MSDSKAPPLIDAKNSTKAAINILDNFLANVVKPLEQQTVAKRYFWICHGSGVVQFCVFAASLRFVARLPVSSRALYVCMFVFACLILLLMLPSLLMKLSSEAFRTLNLEKKIVRLLTSCIANQTNRKSIRNNINTAVKRLPYLPYTLRSVIAVQCAIYAFFSLSTIAVCSASYPVPAANLLAPLAAVSSITALVNLVIIAMTIYAPDFMKHQQKKN